MSVTAREAAYAALEAWRRRGARPDMILSSQDVERRDMALAQKIVSGVLQNSYLLDYQIGIYSGRAVSSLQPQVLDILRLSVYQLIFLDRVPSHAAVSEGVELSKKHAPRAAGLVNAVLRKASRDRGKPVSPHIGDETRRLSVLYSHPVWYVTELLARFGQERTEAILRADNEEAPILAQVNTLKTTVPELTELLRGEGVGTRDCALLENAVYLEDTGAITRLESFQKGLFYVQDAAARLAVTAAGVKPGDTVFDLCAAPGGKSFAAAMDMADRGAIRAFDIHEKKLNLIRGGCERLGISILTAAPGDAGVFAPELESAADTVIADVPCSGFGVLRKKPEIRYKKPEELERLPELQLKILRNAARYVKPGGTLLYSTCTVRRGENEDVAETFLRENKAFAPEPFSLPESLGPCGGMRTILPDEAGTDGFFICKLRRIRVKPI